MYKIDTRGGGIQLFYNRADLKSPLSFNNLNKSAKVEPNDILELRRDIDWELENPGFSGKTFKVSFSKATTPRFPIIIFPDVRHTF